VIGSARAEDNVRPVLVVALDCEGEAPDARNPIEPRCSEAFQGCQ
jgi:hypothetical protein